MKELLKIVRILFAVDVGIVLFCYLEDNMKWFLNTQVAFFATSLIVVGSFIGYFNLVNRNLEEGNVGEDILKKYEDPYNLDDEEDEIKEIPKQKKKLKWYEALLVSFKGGMNLVRILGYVALIAGFIWLVKTDMFDYMSFFFGVSIVPAVTLLHLYAQKKNYLADK
jgi:hypothetical protein